MDRENAVKLKNWIQSMKFQLSSQLIADQDYFSSPIYKAHDSLNQFIKYQSINFSSSPSDADVFSRFGDFKKILLSNDFIQILAILESIITKTDYGLTLYRVASTLSTCVLIHKPFLTEKSKLQIIPYPGQSILEILETLLVPNLPFVNHFDFVVPRESALIYAASCFISDAIKRSNLCNVSVSLEATLSSVSYPTISYPPTLAIVFDDADIFSSVNRLLDMLVSLSNVHRKIDIWLQQSVRSKFISKLEAKMSKPEDLKIFAGSLQTDAIIPILSPSKNRDEVYVKLLTFRKVDELVPIIKRYQTIRGISLWTSNVSSAFEITRNISNCQQFTINTINDCPGTQTVLNQTDISYKLLSEPFFVSRVPFDSFTSHIDGAKSWKTPLRGNKDFLSLSIEDRYNAIVSLLVSRTTPQAIELIRKALLGHSSFKMINKCLKMCEIVPVGLISVHFDKIENITDQSLIFGLIGSILLYGNCCLVLATEIPETITDFFAQFNSTFPSSILVVSPSRSTIPYGWIKTDSEVVGLSFGLEHLTSLIGFDDCIPLFGLKRSHCFPVADQLSLIISVPSGY